MRTAGSETLAEQPPQFRVQDVQGRGGVILFRIERGSIRGILGKATKSEEIQATFSPAVQMV
jgi:hypothetical protein